MELAFICRRVHTELEGTAILSRSRGGTDSSNPLSSSGESDANLNFAGASRSNDRLPALADDLVRRRVTVIAATSTPWPWRERRRRR